MKRLLISIARRETWIKNRHLIYLAYCLLSFDIGKSGIWFFYKGDTILWLWPWRRKGYRYISLLFSGTGEFGDVGFNSLKEIDDAWDEYFKACYSIPHDSIEI